jgi:hypothetical protein
VTERIKAILDAVTDRVFAYRPKDKGQQAEKIAAGLSAPSSKGKAMMAKSPVEDWRLYGRIRSIWCALFHDRDRRWTRLHDAWRFDCSYCGNVGVIND